MKKNVSFSLFAHDMKYYIGAEENCALFEKMLPEWEISIFYHPNFSIIEKIDELRNLKCNLIDVSTIDININKNIMDHPIPYFWRFFSFFNEGFNISRDLDSRLTDREVEYIKRWVEGDKSYFVIRDHPWHSQYPAGLFGIKGHQNNFKSFCEKFINENDLLWGHDQIILDQFMKDIPNSDIEYCGFDREDTYIPRKDKSTFIGIQLGEDGKPIDAALLALNTLEHLNL
jgi:hypothetical protein